MVKYSEKSFAKKLFEEKEVRLSKESIREDGKLEINECDQALPFILEWNAKKIYLGLCLLR